MLFLSVLPLLAVLHLSSAQRKKATLGECQPSDGLAGACVFDPKVNCVANTPNQCPKGYRCCSQGCSPVCKAVTVNGRHPGTCKRAKGPNGLKCEKDNQCASFEKCCSKKGAGRYCKQVRSPTTPPRKQKQKKERKQKQKKI